MSNSNLDDKMDDAYWNSVIEPPEINDLPPLSEARRKKLESDLLKPAHIKWVGEDKAVVVRHKDYASMTRGNNWPWDRDQIDYDPYQDESWDKWKEEDDGGH